MFFVVAVSFCCVLVRFAGPEVSGLGQAEVVWKCKNVAFLCVLDRPNGIAVSCPESKKARRGIFSEFS